jgi:hypothetical protein
MTEWVSGSNGPAYLASEWQARGQVLRIQTAKASEHKILYISPWGWEAAHDQS